MRAAERPVTVVIAPDSFKGSASATVVAEAIGAGWLSERQSDVIRYLPMADGGEGTLDAFEVAVAGSERRPVTVTGPDDRSAHSSWLLLPPSAAAVGGIGVVELASTSGITMLEPLRPLDAHTFGFGEAIAAALDAGVSSLILAIGGSSSTDGGAGALEALGAVLMDASGRTVPRGNRGLGVLSTIDLTGMRPLPPGGATIVSDVTSPLFGPDGAAYVFGPQKGATADEVALMDSNLRQLARILRADERAPGAGAAGGAGFGLLAWGATVSPGAAAVAHALGASSALENANVLITGEGRFDSQSAAGKVPSYLAGLATEHGIPALLVAGSIQAPTEQFASAVELSELAGGAEAAMDDPVTFLRLAGASLARAFAS
jgi:glycerate 2-kinase